MNKKTIVIIAMLSAAAMFTAGWYSNQCYDAKLFATSELKKSTAELAGLQLKIELLDTQKYESVKTHINIDINSQLLLISALLSSSSNENDIVVANKILSRVAKHRKQFPFSYPQNITGNKNNELNESVEAILAKYINYRP